MNLSSNRSRHRRVVLAGAAIAACALLIAAGIAAGASTTAVRPEIKACGHVDGTVAVAAHRVTCANARSVARTYLRGNHHPAGYRCRRFTVDVAAGWYARCTKQSRLVVITPE